MDTHALSAYIADRWDADIVGQLVEYIKIPNKSPMFDADWQKHGYMEQATQLLADWAKAQAIDGMQVEIVRLENRTPLIRVCATHAHRHRCRGSSAASMGERGLQRLCTSYAARRAHRADRGQARAA